MRFVIFYFFLNASLLMGADFKQAQSKIEKDLKNVNSELDQQRAKIFSERQALLRKQAQMKKAQGEDSDNTLSLKEQLRNLKVAVSDLSKEVSQKEKVMVEAQKQMLQMRRALEPIIPFEYSDAFKLALEKQDTALTQKDYSAFLQLLSSFQLDLLKMGSQVNRHQVSAIAANGTLQEMQLISLGHAQFYLNAETEAGLLVQQNGSLQPELQSIAGLVPSLTTLQQGSEAALPFDFTAGLAMKEAVQEKSLIEHFKAGGIIIYPLVFLGFLCLITGLYKTIQLYTVRSRYDDKVQHLLSLIDGGDTEAAKEYLSSLKNPIHSLLTEAFEQHHASRENLEEHLNENILSQLPSLDRFLTVLSVSAGAAPLLGLLGTVMGIIKTFEMIGIYGTGDANRMAGGISEALVTTEMGLIVAIPALIWHAVLNRRLRTIVSNLEKAMLSFVNACALKGDKS